MSGICSRPSCSTLATARGMCESHYRRHIRMGFFGLVDATPVRAHLVVLRGLGWTWEQIGSAAGHSSWTAHHLFTHPEQQRLRKEVAASLLAIPAVSRASHRGMDTTGALRRLRALQWMGWPMSKISAHLGRPQRSLYAQIFREEMSARLILDISAMYEELSHLTGPSKISSTKARRSGYHPPAAWDVDTIDDPDAQPNLGEDDSVVSLGDEAWHLWRGGLGEWEIAARIGVSENYVRTLIRVRRRARERAELRGVA